MEFFGFIFLLAVAVFTGVILFAAWWWWSKRTGRRRGFAVVLLFAPACLIVYLLVAAIWREHYHVNRHETANDDGQCLILLPNHYESRYFDEDYFDSEIYREGVAQPVVEHVAQIGLDGTNVIGVIQEVRGFPSPRDQFFVLDTRTGKLVKRTVSKDDPVTMALYDFMAKQEEPTRSRWFWPAVFAFPCIVLLGLWRILS